MASLLGSWKLVEARAFDRAGNELAPPFGEKPMGFVHFERGRIMAVVCDGSPTSQLSLRAFVSYVGSYQFDGETLVTRVDGASSPDLIVDQVRGITFEGPDRFVAIPLSLPLSPKGRSAGLRIIWERIS